MKVRLQLSTDHQDRRVYPYIFFVLNNAFKYWSFVLFIIFIFLSYGNRIITSLMK